MAEYFLTPRGETSGWSLANKSANEPNAHGMRPIEVAASAGNAEEFRAISARPDFDPGLCDPHRYVAALAAKSDPESRAKVDAIRPALERYNDSFPYDAQKQTRVRPEEGVRLVSANNSVQIEKLNEGNWMTTRVLDTNALAPGVHSLKDAMDMSKFVHPQRFGGPVVHVSESSVYQMTNSGAAKHARSIFKARPAIGQCFEVSYSRGVGTVKGELSLDQSRVAMQKRGLRR